MKYIQDARRKWQKRRALRRGKKELTNWQQANQRPTHNETVQSKFRAVADIQSTELLIRICLDEEIRVQKAAVNCVADQRVLADIILACDRESGGWGAVEQALDRITDEQLLASIARKALGTDIRFRAFLRISDHQVIVALGSRDLRFVPEIDDPRLLYKIYTCLTDRQKSSGRGKALKRRVASTTNYPPPARDLEEPERKARAALMMTLANALGPESNEEKILYCLSTMEGIRKNIGEDSLVIIFRSLQHQHPGSIERAEQMLDEFAPKAPRELPTLEEVRDGAWEDMTFLQLKNVIRQLTPW